MFRSSYVLCANGDVFLKICNDWIQLIVQTAKCQTAVERNTALQCWCAEAPSRKAQAIKWKIPAEDVFPFLIWRKRVLLEACMSVANTEKRRRRWENDLIDLKEFKHKMLFWPSRYILAVLRLNNPPTHMLYNCLQDPQLHMPDSKIEEGIVLAEGQEWRGNTKYIITVKERPREQACCKQHVCVRFSFNCSLNTSRMMALAVYYNTNPFNRI